MSKLNIEAILAEEDVAKAKRSTDFPTEFDCLRSMQQAFYRLRDLGWNEAVYAPKDGRAFEAVVFGCAKPMTCQYVGDVCFAQEAGDLWPCRPSLFRPIQPRTTP